MAYKRWLLTTYVRPGMILQVLYWESPKNRKTDSMPKKTYPSSWVAIPTTG